MTAARQGCSFISQINLLFCKEEQRILHGRILNQLSPTALDFRISKLKAMHGNHLAPSGKITIRSFRLCLSGGQCSRTCKITASAGFSYKLFLWCHEIIYDTQEVSKYTHRKQVKHLPNLNGLQSRAPKKTDGITIHISLPLAPERVGMLLTYNNINNYVIIYNLLIREFFITHDKNRSWNTCRNEKLLIKICYLYITDK